MRTSRALVALLVFGLLASAGTYRVRYGDTLGGIAQKAGLSVGTLARANGIGDPNRLREGQVLTIPSATAAPAAAAPAALTVHRVARGETLGAIAARYHTTVARIAQVNGIRDVDAIGEGAVLRLDGGASWVCPVPALVRFVSGFGDGRGERKHLGVDIAAPRGTIVVANVAGYFKRHPNPLGGNAYYLEGDDGSVYYGAHLDSYSAVNGHVVIGQVLGRVGDTGNARGTLPHLHFERMPHGGPSVDPLGLLVRACRYH